MRAGQAGDLLGHLGSGAALSHEVNNVARENLQGAEKMSGQRSGLVTVN